ncbi:DNA polymerase III subunit alpha [Paenibacillus chitinolyticus]|uniref:DNA-directed DNA polymerase n=1 Tax=Paenibacillus chitinolyticus TaxID=79263 RepID=A0ABT4FRN0_9BACL|nr:DNA polymerase III subunit alpha [Paenibacillus chitinolyticus]MCY9592320.1 DNA polymerase III subunit alpha [Paenibacillus chitinolyticus]MCY9599782.1 DNA polymerase III subunit alpha [Paenibacillus chitinolyticus]
MLRDNYTVYHCHSDLSNPTTSMSMDSTTKFEQYLKVANELEMNSFCFSEHGSIMNWIKKKQTVEKYGMKYIHANEIYVTEYIDREKGLIRDNMHYMLIAKNEYGVKELNKLTTLSNNRKDGHYYFNPRLSLDEVINTSDNIIMTTACLASPLWRALQKNNAAMLNKLLEFLTRNKHRVFLEIQYHLHPEQIKFNQWLFDFSKSTGIPLIAGTDTHSLNQDHAAARKIMMKAKGATYGDEDLFDLTFKSYEELVDKFEEQSAIPRHAYLEAIHNTNVMADMVEEFTLDSSPKYPKLYEDSEKVFKEKINEGIVARGTNKLPSEQKKRYYERVREEFDTYKKLGTIDYMLLQKNIIDYCYTKEIYPGYGRGSVNGSLIAYLLRITEMDSIKHKLNFFRFLNPERISLADIDIDFPPSRRQEVIDYVASIPNIHFSEIITFNTVALKGAIREVGRALQLDASLVDETAKAVFKDEEKKDCIPDSYRKKYPELFKYVDLVSGVIISVGSHPSGYVVSPVNLDDSIGLCYTKESKYPVSQVNMKELDSCNFVKLDILGLDNIEIINETCRLAGIERLVPDNMNVNDEVVWESMKDSGLGIFQWESESAHRYYKELFKQETIKKIREVNPEISLIELFSIGNGAIRPSGSSYRESLAAGIFKDHGHKELNNSLNNTHGYLISQEQIMNFLVDFCGYSMAESDTVRRGLSKKEGTEQYIPLIRDRFVSNMREKFSEDEEHSKAIIEPFLQVILDAQYYGFSDNHSNPYSHIGYGNGYLRHYYSLEFLTVMLNIAENLDKVGKIAEYANSIGVSIKPIMFRKSVSEYMMAKEENAIYKGIKSIKYLNEQIAKELYELRDNTYESFCDLLVDILENTTCDSRQLQILIRLNFFKEFGENKELISIYDEFVGGKDAYKKTLKDITKLKRLNMKKKREAEIRSSLKEKRYPIHETVLYEKELMGYAGIRYPNAIDWYCIVDMDKKYTPRLTIYDLMRGIEKQIKVDKKKFYSNGNDNFKIGDLLHLSQTEMRPKSKLVDGKWVKSADQFDEWLVSCKIKK